MKPISPSEITPKELYFSRRSFIKAAGLAAGAAALAACAPNALTTPEPALGPLTLRSRVRPMNYPTR
jgi:hypothetical protein